jgi:Rieske Fe-S protein
MKKKYDIPLTQNDGRAMVATSTPCEGTRRDFFLQASGAAIMGCALLAPAVPSVIVFFSPLTGAKTQGHLVQLTRLEELSIGAAPQLFQVMAEPTDAWSKKPLQSIGAAYLQRIDEKRVRAFNALCPHVSGSLVFRESGQDFYCPLHESKFSVEGKRSSTSSPSPRDMDELEVEIRAEGEVWVTFKNFAPNIPEKRPV